MKLAVFLLLTSSLFAQRTMFYSQNQNTAALPTTFAFVTSSTTGCDISSGGTPNCSYGLHSNPVAGQLMVVGVWWPDSGTRTATFACTNNGSFTAVGSKKTGTGTLAGFSGQMFYKVLTSSGADTCTPTFSTNVTLGGWLSQQYTFTGSISGTDGTPVYSNTAASGTTATISGLTTANSSGIVVAMCLAATNKCTAANIAGAAATSRNDSATACNGYTGTSCGSTNANYNNITGAINEDKFNVTAGSISATFTVTNSGDDVILGLLAF